MDTQQIDALEAEAIAAETEPEAPGAEPGQPAAPEGPDKVAEAKAVFSMVVALASPLLPYLPSIYTEERLEMLAGAYVPVAEKHGWDMGEFLAGWSAEIALVGVAAPLAIQTMQAHRAHAAALAASRAKAVEEVKEAKQPAMPSAMGAPGAVADNDGTLAAA